MSRWILFVSLIAVCLVSCNSDDGGSGPAADTTDPDVSMLQPANGANVTAGNVLVRAQATDNEGIAKVEFYIDGAKIGEDASGASNIYEYTWNAAGLGSGTAHTVRAHALDTSGNDDNATVTVTICPCPAGPTYHSDNITASETWHACCNPHIVTGLLGIESGATLTIEPGCIVRFEPDAAAGIICGWSPGTGSLVAVGKPDSMIVFTSNAAMPAPGDWAGFGFHEGTFATARLSYCTIEYAGYAETEAIWLDFGAVLRMDHCILRYGAGKGISYDHFGHLAQFTGNTITGCANYPLEVNAEYVRELGTGNDFTGNAAGKDVIQIFQGTVETTCLWRDQGVPYRVPDGNYVSVGTQVGSAVLTIEPGTVIQFGLEAAFSIGYVIYGGLIAVGTVSEPIIFTSAQANPQPGDWSDLYFGFDAISAQCQLSHCVIEYGGGRGQNIWLDSAVPTITDCEINHSADWGISLSGSEYPDPTLLENENSFTGNASGNVHILE
jgi:hypothetical protein